jgi:hypothetical protein
MWKWGWDSPWCLRPVQYKVRNGVMWQWNSDKHDFDSYFYNFFGFPHCPKPFGRLKYCVTKPFRSLFCLQKNDFNIPLWALANWCSADYRRYGGEEGWLGGNGEAYCPWMDLRSPPIEPTSREEAQKITPTRKCPAAWIFSLLNFALIAAVLISHRKYR